MKKHPVTVKDSDIFLNGTSVKNYQSTIYNDPNIHSKRLRDSKGIPIGVDSNSLFLLIVVESDVPFEYLTVLRRVSINE